MKCPTCGAETGGLFGNGDGRPCVLTFATVGLSKTWCLTQQQIDAWTVDYPQQDVLGECRRARAWIEANTEQRKTAKGMPRFLVAWLNKAVERRVMLPTRPGPEARNMLAPVHQARECLHVERCDTRAICDHKELMPAKYPHRRQAS